MNRERWLRLQELLPQFLDTPEQEREAFLDAHCADEAELRADLVRLAAQKSDAGHFLEPPNIDVPPFGEPGSLFGDFEIIRELRPGGMGRVFLAREMPLQRDVALKILPREAADPRRLERFERESIAASRLVHPNIARLLRAGEIDGVRYLAMDFVKGHDLRRELDLVGSAEQADEALALPAFRAPSYNRACAKLVRSIADALAYAHAEGVHHRDVKPQNIVLDEAGTPRLVDFGLAKVVTAESVSKSGDFAGTVPYMSPEQALAKRVAIDHRTDVYSLGVVLFEMLTMRLPFEGDTVEKMLYAISFSDAPRMRRINSRVHRDLETICMKALEKSPARRFDTAGEMARELGRFLDGMPLSIKPSMPVIRVARRLARSRIAMVTAGFLVVLAVVVPWLTWAAEARARRDAAERAAVRAESILDGEVSTVDAGVLAAALDELMRTEPSIADDRISAAIQRIRAQGEDWVETGRAAMSRARERTRAGKSASAAFDEALQLLRAAALVLPERQELLSEADYSATLPALTVDQVAPGLPVYLRRVDMSSAMPEREQRWGETPIERRRISLGLYRITIVQPGVGHAEIVRLFDRRGEERRTEAVVRPSAQVTAGMVRIEACTWESEILGRGRQSVHLEPYWIDETEVSIGQYREFLRATGRPAPREWLQDDSRELYERILAPPAAGEPDKQTEWDNHPMAGVTLLEAVAYAEWRGKRLPTVFEWDRAAQSLEYRLYPWPPSEPRPFVELAVLRSGPSEGSPLEHYLRATEPVDSRPGGASADGLLHMLGNVKEWTSTPVAHPVPGDPDGPPIPTPTVCILRGSGHDTWPQVGDLTLDLTSYDSIDRRIATLSIGFRCAKSVR